jgi:HPt (histidine-containing phosphotransfer) domain-containing protein
MFFRSRTSIPSPAPIRNHTDEPDLPPLDVGIFKELHATLGGDSDRVRNVYTKFLDTAAQRIEELRHQPIAESRRTLHALKGTAAMVGATRLAALAGRLQEAPTTDETLAQGIGDIEVELTHFQYALSEELQYGGHVTG